MRNFRNVCRVILVSKGGDRVLLARNKGADFWYPPGGGLEETDESLRACAVREVKEETGKDCTIDRLFYVQEFKESADVTFLEYFWLGRVENEELDKTVLHIDDEHGQVDEVRWFRRDELKDLKVFPVVLKDEFWRHKETSTYDFYIFD